MAGLGKMAVSGEVTVMDTMAVLGVGPFGVMEHALHNPVL